MHKTAEEGPGHFTTVVETICPVAEFCSNFRKPYFWSFYHLGGGEEQGGVTGRGVGQGFPRLSDVPTRQQ